jgi:hypothetical protein
MKRQQSFLMRWLRWSIATCLGLIAIYLCLPAIFLLLRQPSFAIGNGAFWLLRWQNDVTGSGLQVNLMPLFALAILIGFMTTVMSDRR